MFFWLHLFGFPFFFVRGMIRFQGQEQGNGIEIEISNAVVEEEVAEEIKEAAEAAAEEESAEEIEKAAEAVAEEESAEEIEEAAEAVAEEESAEEIEEVAEEEIEEAVKPTAVEKEEAGEEPKKAEPSRKEKKQEKKQNKPVKDADERDLTFETTGGRQTTLETIAEKIPDGVDTAYIRLEENKIYWVKGKETGTIDIW